MMPVGGRQIDPSLVVGTRAHAARVTEGRHPGVRDALQWLTFSHLPEQLRPYSEPFYVAGVELVRTILTDSPELTTALNKLVEAKDSAVRAGIKNDTGRAGSVPRPQSVVNPPVFGEIATTTPGVTTEMGPGHYGDREVSTGTSGPAQIPVPSERPPHSRPIRDNPQA